MIFSINVLSIQGIVQRQQAKMPISQYFPNGVYLHIGNSYNLPQRMLKLVEIATVFSLQPTQNHQCHPSMCLYTCLHPSFCICFTRDESLNYLTFKSATKLQQIKKQFLMGAGAFFHGCKPTQSNKEQVKMLILQFLCTRGLTTYLSVAT